MKLSLLAAALVALTLTACDRPKQALPENSSSYGTRLEEGTTLDQERGDKYKPPVTDDKSAAASDEDEYSGQAVLPGHALDGNGNPIRPGQSTIPAGH
ncbi:MAG: hypothetical protein M3Q16_04830 [Pseudomonadota bacterium]|nr:hypothetical protein [Pseudomonadota bacterium]